MRYTYQNNQYRLFQANEHIADYPEVAIMVDVSCKTLLKHGSLADVQKYFEYTRTQYIAAGLTHIAEALVLISSKEWDIDELNRCLNIADYAARMIQTRKIIPKCESKRRMAA